MSKNIKLVDFSQCNGKTSCALLCFAVLCCALLCCAVLCCAVLCCAVLCFAVLCCALLCFALLQCIIWLIFPLVLDYPPPPQTCLLCTVCVSLETLCDCCVLYPVFYWLPPSPGFWLHFTLCSIPFHFHFPRHLVTTPATPCANAISSALGSQVLPSIPIQPLLSSATTFTRSTTASNSLPSVNTSSSLP